ncbi:hypothetical protein DSECCO2_579000 [anaerobic digester metagenome]
MPRMIIPGITARHKDMAQMRTLPVVIAVLLHFGPEQVFIRQIHVGRCPYPIINAIIPAYGAYMPVHLFLGEFHVGTGRIVKRNRLYTVCPENSQLADILLILLLCPCIVGIGGIAITQLMSPDGIIRCALYGV